MKIGIAGIGGIGSNIAQHLARAGVKKIKIVDFDFVETSNLNRQFYFFSQVGKKKTDCLEKNLKAIFPAMEIEKINRKIKPGDAQKIFSNCDIVVEGFDDKNLKKMMVEEFCKTDKLIVSASGIAGETMDNITTKKMGNCFIVGDFTSDQTLHGVFGPKVTIVAAIMAGIILKHIKEKTDGKTNRLNP
jgi:sulfur carrier protein ThiS adenylyltransferase